MHFLHKALGRLALGVGQAGIGPKLISRERVNLPHAPCGALHSGRMISTLSTKTKTPSYVPAAGNRGLGCRVDPAIVRRPPGAVPRRPLPHAPIAGCPMPANQTRLATRHGHRTVGQRKK